MDLQADKKWIQKELANVNDSSLLEAIKNILKYRTKYNPTDLFEYNKDIELAEDDIKAGRVYPQKELDGFRSQLKEEV